MHRKMRGKLPIIWGLVWVRTFKIIYDHKLQHLWQSVGNNVVREEEFTFDNWSVMRMQYFIVIVLGNNVGETVVLKVTQK